MKKFDFGWIDDPSNRLEVGPSKKTIAEVAVGVIATGLCMGFSIMAAYWHGAKDYEKAEYDLLDKLGKIDRDYANRRDH